MPHSNWNERPRACGHSSLDRADSGTTNQHRLEENLGAAAIQLSADDLQKIDRAASQIDVHGGLPEHLQKLVGRALIRDAGWAKG